MHLQVFPAASVVLHHVVIRDCDAASVCLTIERAHIGVSVAQLFRRIVHFDTVTLHRPCFTLTRDAGKHLNIDDLVRTLFPQKTLPPKGNTAWVKEFQFFVKEVVIANGSITFKDYALSSASFPVTVDEIYLRTGSFSYTEATPITFRCSFMGENQATKIGFEGLAGPLFPKASFYTIPWRGTLEANDVPLMYFRPYLAGWEKIGSLQGLIDGEFSFDGTIAGDFAASGSLVGKDLSITRRDIFAEQLTLKKVQGRGDVRREGHTVTVPSLSVTVPGVSAEVNGSMLFAEPWNIDVAVLSENLKYKDVLLYLPVSLFPDTLKTALTKKVQSGTVDSLSLQYTGTSDRLLQDNGRGALRDLDASVVFHGISFVSVGDVAPVEDLRGTITYKNKAFVLDDVTCTMGACTLEQCRVTVTPEVILSGTAAAVLDLGDIGKILQSKSLPPRVKHELRHLTRIDGGGLLTLTFAGASGNLGELDFNGELTLLDATIDCRLFRQVLTGLNGRITFDRDILIVHPSKGLWARSPIDCYGKIPHYRSRQSEVQIHVESDKARLDDLSAAFFPWMDIKKENLISAKTDFYCKGYRKKRFSFYGSADLEGASFSIPAFPHPFTDVQGSMTFSREGLTFSQVHGMTGSSHVVFTGAWTNFKEPVITGRIEANAADLSDFLTPPGGGGMSSRPLHIDNVALTVKEGRFKDLFVRDIRTFVNYSDGVFTFPSVRAGAGHFRGFTFEAVHNVHENNLYAATFTDRIITVPFASVRCGGGTWEGTDVRIPCGPENPELFSLTSTIKTLPVERIMQWFPADRRSTLTGTLDLDGSVAGMGKTFHEAVKNLEGGVKFSIRKGIMKQAKILSKIFSLLNVSRMFSQDYSNLLDSGMHFNTIDGSFQIDKGVLHTESILLDSAAMKIDALGDIDVGGRTVDMEIAVQPFESVDKVLGKIPILGTVLIGEEGALVISYYRLEGPLDDPNLKSVVFQSLGRKGQSIFKSIYNIPDNVLFSPSKSLWNKMRGTDEGESGEAKEH